MTKKSETLKWAEEFFAEGSEFSKWCQANEMRLTEFRKCSDFSKELLFAQTAFWLEKYSAGWDEALKLVADQRKLIGELKELAQSAETVGEIKAKFENFDKISAADKQRDNLARGRIAAVKKRQADAKRKRAQLDRAIDDLFTAKERPGLAWGISKITDYITKNLPQLRYSSATISKAARRIKAKHRKAENR